MPSSYPCFYCCTRALVFTNGGRESCDYYKLQEAVHYTLEKVEKGSSIEEINIMRKYMHASCTIHMEFWNEMSSFELRIDECSPSTESMGKVVRKE